MSSASGWLSVAGSGMPTHVCGNAAPPYANADVDYHLEPQLPDCFAHTLTPSFAADPESIIRKMHTYMHTAHRGPKVLAHQPCRSEPPAPATSCGLPQLVHSTCLQHISWLASFQNQAGTQLLLDSAPRIRYHASETFRTLFRRGTKRRIATLPRRSSAVTSADSAVLDFSKSLSANAIHGPCPCAGS